MGVLCATEKTAARKCNDKSQCVEQDLIRVLQNAWISNPTFWRVIAFGRSGAITASDAV
jgi:hypothetical protein